MTASTSSAPDQPAATTSLPPAGAAAFRSKFLGLDGRVDRLILTPLGTILSTLADAGRFQGYWPSRLVRGVPIVQGPQGRPITDAIFNLPAGSEVIFLGLGGGLRQPAVQGKWVSISRAWNGRRAYDCSLTPPPDLDVVSGVTVGSLTESWRSTGTLAERGHVVDMETSHIYEAASTCGIKALSLLLISDEPPHKPFWETDLGSLSACMAPIVDVIEPWLTGGSLPGSPTRTRLAGRRDR